MAELLDRLPRKENWHRTRYRILLQRFGIGQKGKEKATGVFLAELNVKDTPKIRDALRKRMQGIDQEPEFSDKSEILRGEQTAHYDKLRIRLEGFLERAENSEMSEFSPSHIIEIYETLLKFGDHAAKLHGLYNHEQKPSGDTDKGSDTGSIGQPQKSDADRAVEILCALNQESKDE